ncbi:MAG: tRNA (N6-isopentenyl adenosine(37)-C2)-methylthiotransferase MiaB [Thermoguttaceae bacterium]|nr:tRNA (N6-isopentenyl adenosine(37)-C2)-methylthiotransferase MiaB [Thermoguttaceae bacterium]MDW8077880.1 tRNA (N6-isopentenyl adenosine(37)-C2)-methylthiotransferase MiaB [Thermoguttaceae bacterium]
MSRKVYLVTFGCQMNDLDSELVSASLLEAGYELVNSIRDADIVLFNTCSVRQHAEDKVYSALGRLKRRKRERPGTIIGVLGCMAQKDGQLIFERAPWVDLVVGPGQLGRLVDLLDDLINGRKNRVLELSLPRRGMSQAEVARSFVPFDPPRRVDVRPLRQQAMVRIMRGCDKFCTYCVVPTVRGPEQCRPAREIQAEVQALVDQGCVEITLLGQTVNSYVDKSEGRTVRLSDLLERISQIGGLRRIKFVTNHPKHMTDDLLQAVRDLPPVCPYLHVPAQSGSDRVLARMRRGYTVGEYREMICRIREFVPAAAITSDFIVGFCGESEEDFEQTVELVRWARFRNCFVFKYSPRPGTKAAELFVDDVPLPVKQQRNQTLLAVQNEISLSENQAFVGQRVEVLVEGLSKREREKSPALLPVIAASACTSKSAEGDGGEGLGGLAPASLSGSRRDCLEGLESQPLDVNPRGRQVSIVSGGDLPQLSGRTVCDRIVVFPGPVEWIGRFVEVHIERVSPVTLFGRVSRVCD